MKTHTLGLVHILPHMGGGVGSVMRALLKACLVSACDTFTHTIVTLETLNAPSREFLNAQRVPWFESASITRIHQLIAETGLVLVHWWNHPLLMQLLHTGLPPCRLAMWSHVNGYCVPQAFFPALFNMPDLFVFATSASLAAPAVQSLPVSLQHKLRVIRSCAGIPYGAEALVEKSLPFQVGYIGTVEPAKMHPDFLRLCSDARLPTPCFVIGGPAHQALRDQARVTGLSESFDIRGPVDDPKAFFKRLHAFAYPLDPRHYGTGEQVLVEAMAFGAVPVVLDNPPERALIRHGETGFIAKTHLEFSNALGYLANNPVIRERMAKAGHHFVHDACHIDESLKLFESLFLELMTCDKTAHRLNLDPIDGIQTGSPFHLYLSSCAGQPERDFALRLARDKDTKGKIPASFSFMTRGAPLHYLRLLGPDQNLEQLCQNCGDSTHLPI